MILLRYHFDVDFGGMIWHIDCPQVPELHVTAATLVDCQQRALDELGAAGVDLSDVSRVVAGWE
jgi:hypothetical protein